MSFEEAIEVASRDESFRASVYAMNTLLIQKGVYTQEEFRAFFLEWIEKVRSWFFRSESRYRRRGIRIRRWVRVRRSFSRRALRCCLPSFSRIFH
jgi:hypothetical protein